MRSEGHVFLVGFMGCGKSRVAPELAALLDRPWVDTDDEVERLASLPVAGIIDSRGVEAFRDLESRVLGEFPDHPAGVVATGGGLMLRRANRLRLQRAGVSIWLDSPLAVVERRLGDGLDRPLWRGLDGTARWALYERRRVVYALADRRVEVGLDEPAAVARRVLQILDR